MKTPSLTNKEKRAAYELSDQTSYMLHDAENATFLLNELFEEYFDRDFSGSQEDIQRLMLRYSGAQMRARILIDYVVKLTNDLRELHSAAAEGAEMTHLSNRIAEFRVAQKMSQEQLATASGLTLDQIVSMEAGTAKVAMSKDLLRLAQALGTKVDTLFSPSHKPAEM